jgi:hypothetical protein
MFLSFSDCDKFTNMKKLGIKLTIVLAAVTALTACEPILAYWAPRHDYVLSTDDRRLISLIYGENFISTIQARIFTKDLPYGSDIKGMYSIDAGEIWMNENAAFNAYDIIHEVTHYHQDNVRHRDLGDANQPVDIPDDLSQMIGAEPEAYLVQMYCLFHDGYDRAYLNGQLYYDDREDEFLMYIDTFIR